MRPEKMHSLATAATSTLTALVCALLMLLAASFTSRAQPAPEAPPNGALSGLITVKNLPVKVKLQMNGSTDSLLEYGPTISCALALEYIAQTADGHAYAFKPRPGGSAGMAPYCNRLLGGRAWLKPIADGRYRYLPTDDQGIPLEQATVAPVAASR